MTKRVQRIGKIKALAKRIGKIKRLAKHAGTPGEQAAAEAALERIQATPEGRRVIERHEAVHTWARNTKAALKPDEVAPRRMQLTDALVKQLPVPLAGNVIYWDELRVGLGVRVTAGGARSYVYNFRVRGSGKQRRHTIGGIKSWTIGGARIEAKRLRRLIDADGDPVGDHKADREASTMADLIKRFVNEHLTRRRASTAADYLSMIVNHIAPHFGVKMEEKNGTLQFSGGTTRVRDVSFDDVDKLHRKISKAGHLHRANRVIAVVSKMFALSVRWGMRADNPCKGIEKNLEHHRRRYLREGELPRLLTALAGYPDRRIANVFLLLILTGARRGEVLAMRWADVDLGTGKWSKPPSSTKQESWHEVPLSEPVKVLLGDIRKQQTAKRKELPEYVFPGNGETAHIVSIKKAWAAICKSAGITGLRIHDLRHSFASQLVSGGASLPLIGALLGHASPATTQRYAHLFDSPQRAAVEKVGTAIPEAGSK